MLGKALMRQWMGDDVTGLGSAQADIRVADQVATALAHTKPDWIVLAAAYTDVDGCEVNPALAAAVNTKGAVNVAQIAEKFGGGGHECAGGFSTEGPVQEAAQRVLSELRRHLPDLG